VEEDAAVQHRRPTGHRPRDLRSAGAALGPFPVREMRLRALLIVSLSQDERRDGDAGRHGTRKTTSQAAASTPREKRESSTATLLPVCCIVVSFISICNGRIYNCILAVAVPYKCYEKRSSSDDFGSCIYAAGILNATESRVANAHILLLSGEHLARPRLRRGRHNRLTFRKSCI